MNIVDDLIKIVGSENVLQNEPMSKHTTFRIGGNADVFVTPNTTESLESIISYVTNNNIPYYIIGNGSNLLVKDNGFRGVIIQLYKKFANIAVNDNVITAQAGALLSTVAKTALNNSLTGMECLSGIPGTIGGAVCMNAGAYGGEMKDIVVKTKVIHNGKIETISNNDSDFGYRKSKIMSENMIVVETVLSLEKGNKEEIQSKMCDLLTQRNSKQPVELPSAGSTFKRPEGYFAAKLIDDSGLRGYSVGKAQVSPKHCGFVVNNGGATAKDVLTLMHNVSSVVEDNFGVKLEPEVRIIGE
ncbi:MAG: UDP-N-acetylmuramate dehydrogenase [Eubacterium sp.]|nr:UDP-N-acetylmuramate dehydrogenase [Eubacterium sp.]